MKLSALSFIATIGLAASQVAARPVTVYILSPVHAEKANVPATAHLRWGLAAANAEVPVPEVSTEFATTQPSEGFRVPGGRRFKCSMHAKAISMANWVREKVGLPLIEPPHHVHHHHAHMHEKPLPGFPGFVTAHEVNRPVHGSSESVVNSTGSVMTPSGHWVTYQQGSMKGWGHEHHRHWRPQSFSGRLNKALMTLGPWEGRLVAFVLGCGIGSLLRMLYVLTVVTYRSFRPRKDTLEATEIDILFEEVEAPPVYSDEKVAPAEDKPSA